MTVHDLRPRWRVGLRPSRGMSGALPLAADLPSGVSMRVHSPCRHTCSASASAPHFARHPLLHGNVHFPVQIACPERARPTAWRAFAGWLAAPRAAPPGHRIPVPSGWGKMQGKIKGRGTWPLENLVCTWGERGTRHGAAACREGAQCRIGIGEVACFVRWTALVLDGATP
ncbi:hypothetical protein [Stenotrophomonas maltophilia]|uniref:hypothetical protein n=1 Tax=Stenotrophomonas maltophilia TaxID=40324 RepID=UPI000A48A755|nr:hypothetical protein [Stenotrophomonas maltophilia]